VNLFNSPSHRRWDLDLRLVGLDLEQWGVLADDIPFVDQHFDDLGFGEALAEIG